MNSIKSLLMLGVAILVVGCGTYTARFDNAEYYMYVTLTERSIAMENDCGYLAMEQAHLTSLKSTATTLVIYATHRPDAGSIEYAKSVDSLVSKVKAGGSVTYCKESMQNLQTGLKIAMTSLGKRGE